MNWNRLKFWKEGTDYFVPNKKHFIQGDIDFVREDGEMFPSTKTVQCCPHCDKAIGEVKTFKIPVGGKNDEAAKAFVTSFKNRQNNL
jgi:uncharacterized protein (DUF2225 family)